jgi:hypothetical protein
MATKTNEEWMEDFTTDYRLAGCKGKNSSISMYADNWLRTLLASKDMEREDAVAEAYKNGVAEGIKNQTELSPEEEKRFYDKVRGTDASTTKTFTTPPHTEAKEIIRED